MQKGLCGKSAQPFTLQRFQMICPAYSLRLHNNTIYDTADALNRSGKLFGSSL
jgi:hypothetical protein